MNGGLRTNGDPQHLVTATSIEEDALGEELQVIWELEPGAETKDKMALPEPTLPHAGIERPAGDAEVVAGEKFRDLPGFVVMSDPKGRGLPKGAAANWSAGFLPGVYQRNVASPNRRPDQKPRARAGHERRAAARAARFDGRA